MTKVFLIVGSHGFYYGHMPVSTCLHTTRTHTRTHTWISSCWAYELFLGLGTQKIIIRNEEIEDS